MISQGSSLRSNFNSSMQPNLFKARASHDCDSDIFGHNSPTDRAGEHIEPFEDVESHPVSNKKLWCLRFQLFFGVIVLRSEIPSGICAKLRTVAASNNRDHPTRSLYYCLFGPHTYIFVLRAHPVRGESHNQRNATGEVATTSPPFYNKPLRSHVLLCEGWTRHDLHILVTAPFCWLVSHSVTHKHELWIWFTLSYAMMKALLRLAAIWDTKQTGVERRHYNLLPQFCAGFNDAKRQHLSTINTYSDLSFTTIQKQTYRRKQLMDHSDDNSLTALLTKREQVRFREIVNTCTERRAEKRIQRTAWILSQVLRTTLCEHVNGLCPAGWLNEQSITKHWFQSARTVHIVGPLAATIVTNHWGEGIFGWCH